MRISVAQNKKASDALIDANCYMVLKCHNLITYSENIYNKTRPTVDLPRGLPAAISVSLSSCRDSRNVNNLWTNWR